MATTLNTLYPPIMATALSPSVYNEDVLVPISVSSYNSWDEIGSVQISITIVKNNKNALRYGSYTPSVLVYNTSSLAYDSTNSSVRIATIPCSMIKNNSSEENKNYFVPNQYYKIQVRFSAVSCPETATVNSTASQQDFKDALNSYLAANKGYFSEWSTVCLLRPSFKAELKLINFTSYQKEINTGTIENIPMLNVGEIRVAGYLTYDTSSYTGTESINQVFDMLDKYRIQFIQYDSDTDKQTIKYDSGELKATKKASSDDSFGSFDYSFSTLGFTIDYDNIYYLCVYGSTMNGYELEKKYYPVIFKNYTNGPSEEDMKWELTVDNYDGIVRTHIYDMTGAKYTGYIYIRRATDATDFTKWSLMKVFAIKDSTIDIYFEDNTVCSYSWYQYSVQYANKYKLFDEPYVSSKVGTNEIFPTYEDAILSRYDEDLQRDRQLALRFDYQISEMKPVVNLTKVETLGSRYPKFMENAVLNYKQFSISGKISGLIDENKKFVKWEELLANEASSYNNYLEGSLHEDYYATDTKNLTAQDRIQLWEDAPKLEINDDDSDEVKEQKKLWNNHHGTTIADIYNYKTGESDSKLIPTDYNTTDGRELISSFYNNDEYFDSSYAKWDNWYQYHDVRWERDFREQVMAWLNDGNPKLYRSSTEGALCVMITDLSLQPETSLGRLIYNFSATMYEVGDGNDLDELVSLGIYHLDDESGINLINYSEDEIVYEIGQRYTINNTEATRFCIKNYIDSNSEFDFVKYLQTQKNYELNSFIVDGSILYQELNESMLNNLKIFNVRIQFRNLPNPINVESSDIDKIVSKPYHEVKVKTKNNDELLTFYTNRNGFLQFPENQIIERLIFPDIATDIVDIDYIAVYYLLENNKDTATSYAVANYVVGQESGIWLSGEDISDCIKDKYWAEYTDSSTKYLYALTNWSGMSLYANAYSVFVVDYSDTSTDEGVYPDDVKSKIGSGEKADIFEVGMTSIYNGFRDSNINSLMFIGRRMVRIEDYTLIPYMREHEYYHQYSPSFSSYKELLNQSNPVHNVVYNVVDEDTTTSYIYHDRKYYPFITGDQVSASVFKNCILMEWEIENNNTYGVEVNDDIITTKEPLFESIVEQLNTVYLISNNSEEILGIAIMPVNGIINYTGERIKTTYPVL